MSDTESKSAPGGSGARSGMGEAFSINLGTGTAMHTYKLAVPQGVASHTPALSLQYSNSAGLGMFGLGWQLTTRSITAGLDFGAPDDDGLLLHILDNGNEIIASADGTYRALRETAFDRYTRHGDGWQIEERDGLVHQLGVSASARVADPDHPARVVEWWLEHSTDVSGNAIYYTYLQDGGYAYPSAIRYARYEIRFAYGQRADARRNGRYGFVRRQNLRCVAVRLVLDPGAAERIIRSWDIGYTLDPASQVSQLTSITMTSHGLAGDGSEDVRRPPITFAYSVFDLGQFVPSLMTSAAAPPPPLGDVDVALVTLDNAPLPGVLVNRAGREYYWANTGDGGWDAARPLLRAPLTSSFAEAGLAFVDMDGSGTADLMAATAPVAGYYENDGRDGWGNFIAYPRANRVSPAWTDPSLRLTDANGDGLIDAMRSLAGERGGVMVWANGGHAGWSAPIIAANESLAGVDLASTDVYLADMTGDGLDDIVRVRSGAVEYWPSLGRGRFGDRVVMENSPRISHDTPWATTVLVDIDGDGCADLVILSSQGLRVVHNSNGIEFAAPQVLAMGPPPLPGSVRAVNMRGRASAGLVWNAGSDNGARYVQWQCSTDAPAYVLTQVDNGVGRVSAIAYRSAIADYQRDRDAGRMWTTNFPFPYVVVASTIEIDRVSGRRTELQYRYHEAHFEGHTRQFQGFRNTERVTKGDSSRPDTREVFDFLMAQERVAGNGPEHTHLNGLLAGVATYSDDATPQNTLPLITESSQHNLTVLEQGVWRRHSHHQWD